MSNKTGTMLRAVFNKEAELYNDMRSHYPEELFSALVRITKLPANAHLLEIGSGTGQATIALAQRGYSIMAIELGEKLAEVSRRGLKKYGKVEVTTGAFEGVELSAESFDLIYAATSFHWIEPEVRFKKTYSLLKKGGHLAIIHTNHVSGVEGDAFFHDSRAVYKKYEKERMKSAKDKKVLLKHIDEIKRDKVDEKLFEPIFFKTFPLVITYAADEYVKLINTYSSTLAMPHEQRKAFLKELADLINERFNGNLTKKYAMSLTIAKKRLL